jgi:hypothetical protein
MLMPRSCASPFTRQQRMLFRPAVTKWSASNGENLSTPTSYVLTLLNSSRA